MKKHVKNLKRKTDPYLARLRRRGLEEKAREWLKSNKPPRKFRGGRWAWVYVNVGELDE